MNQIMLKPTFTGRRFDKHSLPLELLKDFSALEEMLIAVAKYIFLEDHPKYNRLPKGLFKEVELHLSTIEEGSAIAVINLDEPIPEGLLPSQNQVYIKKAANLITKMLQSVSAGFPPDLPTYLLRYFDKFGRGLRADEKITFSDDKENTVFFTQDLRKKILIASKIDSWTEEETHKALISGIDKDGKLFYVKLQSGETIKAPYDVNIKSAVTKALDCFENRQYVLIKGIVKYTNQSIRKEFESIELLELMDPLDIENRLDDLALLTDGWLDGEFGQKINPSNIEKTKKLFNVFYSDDLPLPHLYPTPEGGIQAEWTIGRWNITFELNFSRNQYEYLAYQSDSNEAIEWMDGFENDTLAWDKLSKSLLHLMNQEAD